MCTFLIFFPEEQHFNSSTPLSESKPPFKTPIPKPTNSNHIFTKTQSTISVCALLIFITLILFTLSSFEPNNDFISSHRNLHHYRRFLSQNRSISPEFRSPALQNLGTLYTRGTSAMNELLICHVSESVNTTELQSFLQSFHKSGLRSKSDLLFIFDSITTIDSFDDVIRVFLKTELLNGTKTVAGGDSPAGFDPTRIVKSGKEVDKGEPIWGRKVNYSNSSLINGGEDGTELTRASYGSVVGFGINELDPENSLSGFLDPIPMGLRRWACYPMILGRVRRKFKKIVLVDVKEVLELGDSLRRVKNQSPETILLSSIRRRIKKPVKSHRKVIDPAVIVGGERGVRRLSAAMLTEIVRSTASQRRKQHVISESGLLSQLVGNEFLQKSIRFIVE